MPSLADYEDAYWLSYRLFNTYANMNFVYGENFTICVKKYALGVVSNGRNTTENMDLMAAVIFHWLEYVSISHEILILLILQSYTEKIFKNNF